MSRRPFPTSALHGPAATLYMHYYLIDRHQLHVLARGLHTSCLYHVLAGVAAIQQP